MLVCSTFAFPVFFGSVAPRMQVSGLACALCIGGTIQTFAQDINYLPTQGSLSLVRTRSMRASCLASCF